MHHFVLMRTLGGLANSCPYFYYYYRLCLYLRFILVSITEVPGMLLTFILASKHPDWDDSTDLNQNKSLQASHIELPRNSSFPMDHFAGTIESRVGQAMQAPKNSDGKALTPSLLINSTPLLQQIASHDAGVLQITRCSNCGTPTFSRSVHNDALLPQPAARSDLPSSNFVSNTSLPQQMVSQNDSVMYPEQAGASTRLAVFSDADFLYTSKAFNVLIFLDVMMVAVPFIFILSHTWIGYFSAGNVVLRTFYILSLIFPVVFAPRLAWFAMMMPFSHVMKR
jgi:hypothetical protein